MKLANLLENLEFGSKDPHAVPLHVDRQGRAILFTLKPDQSIREHSAPSSPFFVVVLRGNGVFAGGDGVEHTCGPNTLLVFDTDEQHTIRAVDELVFIGFLREVPLAQK
jgi:quercetin dioxygenase-like cupin family protein